MRSYADHRSAHRRRLVVWFAALGFLVMGLVLAATTRSVGAQTSPDQTVTADGATMTVSNIDCTGFKMTITNVEGTRTDWTATVGLYPTPAGNGTKTYALSPNHMTETVTWAFSSAVNPATSVEVRFQSNAQVNNPADGIQTITVARPDCTATSSSSSSSTSTSSTTEPPQLRTLTFDTYTVRVNSNCRNATFTVTNSAGGTWSLTGEVTLNGVYTDVTWTNTTPSRTFAWAANAQTASMRFTDSAGRTHALTFKRCQDPETVTSDDGSSASGWLWGGAATGAGALMVGAAVIGYRRRPQD